MDFKFSEKERAIKEEVEHFVKTELPEDWPDRSMHWPSGYGTLEAIVAGV